MGFLAFAAANLRWLFAGFLLTFASSFGQTFFISLFGGEIRAEYGLSHGDFGTLYMAATLASAATLLWIGKFADHSRLDLVSGLILGGLAVTCLAMALSPGIAVLALALFGLRLFGQGMLDHVALTAMARWYNRERGRAIAIAALGHPVGEAVFPAIGVFLAAAIGWRETWVVACVVLALAVPLSMVLLRQSRQPRTPLPTSREGGAPVEEWTRARVLRDPLFWVLLPGLLAPAFIVTGVFFHQVHLVETKGWELAWFAAGYPFFAATSITSGLATGWIIDRWSARRALPAYLLPMAAGLLVLAWSPEPGLALLFFVLAGLTQGGSSAVLAAVWAELYGSAHIGAIRSVAVAAAVLSTAIAPGLMGWLIDLGVAIETQFVAMAVYAVAAAVVFALLSGALHRRACATGAAAP
ncbi:MFS transporter [Rhodobium gokarnense]|uniref:Sugar phosphate permease n=1 Tax=Rhodobium gokarnense TaxID=364296 RepID=A0ABT3H6X1_9HYPH|nr:MFS transporter [Rhodobium gokarnense]MCW2306135.1 sugar phosphate permease [Rhodobium gokarnense]